MKYKSYVAEVYYDDKNKIFWGKVVNITKDGIFFEGRTPEELESDFHGAVDDYIDIKKKHGEKPEMPFSGNFTVRTSGKLHSAAVEMAARKHISLNQFIEQAIEKEVMTGN